VSSREDDGPRQATTLRVIGFEFKWVLPFVDDSTGTTTSQQNFIQMFDDMAKVFRDSASFGYGADVIFNRRLHVLSRMDDIRESQTMGDMHYGIARVEVEWIVPVKRC
jgi:hypothetical protein